MRRFLCLCIPPLLLAACVAPRTVHPPRVAAPPPVVALPPPVQTGDWQDAPLTPGTWRYRAGAMAAEFGPPNQPLFVLRCESEARTVALYRPGLAAVILAKLTTSSGTRSYATGALDGGVGWRLGARDAVLDQIAFSRGRFMVEGEGLSRLILPAWAEVSRVIEDCRG